MPDHPTRERQQEEPIRLDFQSVQKIVFTDHDSGERWVATVREAASACRTAQSQKEFQDEFEDFLAHIHQWSKRHADIVAAAFVGVSSEGLTGVILTSGPQYRLDFDDEITALDIELASKFPHCRADILQSPEEDPVCRVPYIAVERAVQVYGNQS